MQWLQRISRSASSRRLYCFLLLLQLLVIVTAAPRNSETGVSGATGQRVSGGNAAAAAETTELFAQRLALISSSLASQTMNMKEAAKTSSTISGREGDTKLGGEKLKGLNLPDDWNVLVVGSLAEGKDMDRTLTKFQRKRDMVNTLVSLILQGRLGEWIKKLFENKSMRRDIEDAIDQDIMTYTIQENEKEDLLSKNEDMFSSVGRKRFLHKVNTDEQSRLKNTATSSDNNRIRQKRHSWHFMRENVLHSEPHSDLVYSGAPTIFVQWPQSASGSTLALTPTLMSAIQPERSPERSPTQPPTQPQTQSLKVPPGKNPHVQEYCGKKPFPHRSLKRPAFFGAHWPNPNDVDDWYSHPYPLSIEDVYAPEMIYSEKDIAKDYYGEDKGVIKDYYGEEMGIIKDYYGEDKDAIKDYYGEDKVAIKDYDGEDKDTIKDYYGEDKDTIKDYYGEDKGAIKDYYYDGIKDINANNTDTIPDDQGINDKNRPIHDQNPDFIDETNHSGADKDSLDRKVAEDRLRTGGLSEMLQYKKNDLKKNQPLEHLKSHQNPPWPEKDIVGIPSANNRTMNRKPIRMNN